jgi:hypothetical protein
MVLRRSRIGQPTSDAMGLGPFPVLLIGEGETRCRSLWSIPAETLAVALPGVEHQRVLPDPGCYEERDRVTGRDGVGLAAGLLAIGLGFLWHTQAIFLVIGVVLATVTVIALARRQLAFRADHAGILLPGEPDRLTARRGPAVPIPWADVEQIILYSSEPGEQAAVQRIGIKRRIGAVEARKITGWRLDRDRLAAITAAMAPDVRIVGASGKPGPGIEGPGQLRGSAR